MGELVLRGWPSHSHVAVRKARLNPALLASALAAAFYVRCARRLSGALLAVCLPCAHALGIESQLLDTVRGLPPELYFSIPCGTWSARGSEGYLRLVVVSVYGGAGSETYLQRIETPERGSQALKLVETKAFAELNNDHGQYSVSSAICTRKSGRWAVELVASYEHDGPGVEHRITISLQPPYRVLNRRVKLR